MAAERMVGRRAMPERMMWRKAAGVAGSAARPPVAHGMVGRQTRGDHRSGLRDSVTGEGDRDSVTGERKRGRDDEGPDHLGALQQRAEESATGRLNSR